MITFAQRLDHLRRIERERDQAAWEAFTRAYGQFVQRQLSGLSTPDVRDALEISGEEARHGPLS